MGSCECLTLHNRLIKSVLLVNNLNFSIMEQKIKRVEAQFISFFTAEYLSDSVYSVETNAKFEREYAVFPGRMTPTQIKAVGYDSVRSDMWCKFCDKRLEMVYAKELAETQSVAKQLLTIIEQKFPTLKVELFEGEIKKYGDGRLRPACLIVRAGECAIYLTPTLHHENEDFIKVSYDLNEQGMYINDIQVNDVQALGECEKLAKWLETKEPQKWGVNKVCHRHTDLFDICFFNNRYTFRGVEIIQLYHCLAKKMNELFKTNYEYKQDVINTLSKTQVGTYLIGTFTLKKCWGDKWEVDHHYTFVNDNLQALSGFGGDLSVDDLKTLLETIKPYVDGDMLTQS